MIRAWLLVLFSWTSQDGQMAGVLDCAPQNLNLNGSGQTLWVTWNDKPSCSAPTEPLTYELTVFREDQQVHHSEVSVASDCVGLGHSWTWRSHLPLECASHFVKIRSRLHDRLSPWEQSRTIPGRNSSKYEEIFPQDEVYGVGSKATFCCILPDGKTFDKMYLSPHNGSYSSPERISNQRYALTVQLGKAWDRCVDVKCTTKDQEDYGACLYIGYPPDDQDLQCETQDLESVQCFWNTGRDTNLQLKSPTVYQLNESLCKRRSKGRCFLTIKVDSGEKTWTLTAENKLGKVELHDTADLTKRIHMLAPEGVTVWRVNARNISLRWSWTLQRYNNLNLTCQVQVRHKDRNFTTDLFGIGLKTAVLTELIPNWKYHVKVRCGTAQHFWKWGVWSSNVTFHTEGDVPDALDVWMQQKMNQTVILWKKLLDSQSHGDITGYEVKWEKTDEKNHLNRTFLTPDIYNHTLSLDTTQQHVVTVTAKNKYGRSPLSTIIIPAMGPGGTEVKTFSIIGSNRNLDLSWPQSLTASCGYIVVWSPAVGFGPVEWLKLPPNRSTVRISSEHLTEGLRYLLLIYACTKGAPVLLEKREGYIAETRIEGKLFTSLKFNQQDSDAVVSWDPVPLRQQSAFIHGYVLYYWEKPIKVSSITTDDPEATKLMVKDLQMGFYSFMVVAKTTAGECGNTTITAMIMPPINHLTTFVLASMGAVFVLFLITILCFRHAACIEQKVFPPIPKPVVTDNWFSSPVKHLNTFLHPDQSLQTEEVMDVPQLHFKSGPPLNSYINREDMSLPFSQTPNGYSNKPKPVHISATNCPSPSGLPSSLFRSVFSNPTYNPTTEGGDQLVCSEPEVLSGMKTSCGYRPQGSAETRQIQNQDFGIVCNSSYILAPQPSPL